MPKEVSIEVFGADVVCASCVNAPSSADTFEWLQAAISRKFPEQPFSISYIDIEKPQKDDRKQEIIQQILDDEYFYPLVLIEGEVAGEGYIRLKPVFQELEKHGFTPENQQ